MQQFVVPQFIDVEDKIFGPITTHQFLVLLIASIIIFLAYRYADFALFVTTSLGVGGIAILFAFVKVNGQPFHIFLLNIGQTMRRPGLRVWRKYYDKKDLDFLRNQVTEEMEEVEKKKEIHSQHIRNLPLIVNTGGFYRPDEDIYE